MAHRFAAPFVCFVMASIASTQESPVDPDMPVAKGASVPLFEYRAVQMPLNDKQATQALNTLAADRWEYVGPLGNTLVAFRRPLLPSTLERLAKPERERLQGTWRVVSAKFANEKKVEVVRFTFAGENVTISYKDGKEPEKLRYKITPLGSPRALDLFEDAAPSKLTAMCIYDFETDQLRLCGNNTGPRPLEFAENSSFLIVLRRDKK